MARTTDFFDTKVSQGITPTWRGKNKACRKIDDSELMVALKESDNIRQALLKVGMAAKGANYRRAKILLNTNHS